MNLHISQNRRRFITRTLAATASLALTAASRHLEIDGNQIVPDALAKLGAKLKGRVTLPSDADYEMARRVFFWNPETERRPALVVRCAHADDVLYAVAFAHRYGLEVAVRAGGHSHMGWGTSNGLVIDLSGMKQVIIDPARRTGSIDAGALSGEVIRAAGRYGLAPALGECPAVGVSGVTLGGGLGWLSGLHGAACDNLLSARVVTADGRNLRVSEESNPDLLWALRGAGANFGVTTSFDCRLHPVGVVTFGNIFYPVREARALMFFFRDFMAEAPDSFQAALNLTPGDRGVFVTFFHAGDATEAERLLRPFRAVAAPTKDTVKLQEFAELAGTPTPGSPGASFRCVAGVYRDSLSDEVMEILLDRLASAPGNAILGIDHYMHGEVCRHLPDSTAFPLRQPGSVHFRLFVDWQDPASAERLLQWADESGRMLRPSSGERIYANYQSYERKGSAEAVFGDNLSRLAGLKNKYDPTNFFRRNSNIAPKTT